MELKSLIKLLSEKAMRLRITAGKHPDIPDEYVLMLETARLIDETIKRLSVQVDIVTCDGWICIYVNGVLAAEGHSIRTENMLKLFAYNVSTHEADEQWIEELSIFPKDLKDVVLIKRA